MIFEMIQKMVDKINYEIGVEYRYYQMTGKSDMAKIYGMIEMLQIVTGKDYSLDTGDEPKLVEVE